METACCPVPCPWGVSAPACPPLPASYKPVSDLQPGLLFSPLSERLHPGFPDAAQRTAPCVSDLVQVPWLAIRPVGNVTRGVQLQLEKSRPPDSLLDVPCSGFPTSVIGGDAVDPGRLLGVFSTSLPFSFSVLSCQPVSERSLDPTLRHHLPSAWAPMWPVTTALREHQGFPLRQDGPGNVRVSPRWPWS